MLATDPDADRVGIAMKCPDGSYELVSGNEVGVLLLDYIAAGRIEKGTMPEKPVAVKSLVSTPLADAVASSVIWHPSGPYALYPLYFAGLWDAVTITPALQL